MKSEKFNYDRFVRLYPITHADVINHVTITFHPDLTERQRLNVRYDLSKILTSTFELSAQMGFARVTVRDLQKATGISMGGLYKCFSQKDDLAYMIVEGLNYITQTSIELMKNQDRSEDYLLKQMIKGHIYLSQLFKSWYYFVFTEIPAFTEDQIKKIRHIQWDFLSSVAKNMGGNNIVASHMSVIIQDYYLKDWKYRHTDLDEYAEHLFKVALLLSRNVQNLGDFPLDYTTV